MEVYVAQGWGGRARVPWEERVACGDRGEAGSLATMPAPFVVERVQPCKESSVHRALATRLSRCVMMMGHYL